MRTLVTIVGQVFQSFFFLLSSCAIHFQYVIFMALKCPQESEVPSLCPQGFFSRLSDKHGIGIGKDGIGLAFFYFHRNRILRPRKMTFTFCE